MKPLKPINLPRLSLYSIASEVWPDLDPKVGRMRLARGHGIDTKAQKKIVEILRKAAERLAELAEQIEKEG